jgi:ATP-dependent Clp protease ATP-binding subunit ClpC
MRLLEDSLAEAMLSGQVSNGDTAVMDVDADGQVKVLPGKRQELLLEAVS